MHYIVTLGEIPTAYTNCRRQTKGSVGHNYLSPGNYLPWKIAKTPHQEFRFYAANYFVLLP